MKEKFNNAFSGLMDGIRDHSIRTQMILGLMAVCAGLFLRLDSGEWIAVVICIGMVVSTEMLNTCIERLCDLYDTHRNEKIHVIKDLGAGAVLTASLCALVTALIILIRHIM